MTASNAHGLSADFQWQDEYETTLQHIADTDEVDAHLDWPPLKDAIKYKISSALSAFPETPSAILHPAAVLIPLLDSSYSSDEEASASLAIRFMDEATADAHGVSPADKQGFFPSKRQPPTGTWGKQLTAEQLDSERDLVFGMLDEFDTQPPFTIQRLAELVVKPQTHQKTRAKYLSALQRVLSVTATRDAFPISPSGTDAVAPEANGLPADADIPPLNGATSRPRTASVSSQPPSPVQRHSEPLFSPIPFLVRDAPQVEAEALAEIPEMELGGADRTNGGSSPSIPPASEDQESPADADTSQASLPDVVAAPPKPLGVPPGRVDELDGSDSIQPLSSTTAVTEEDAPKPKRQRSSADKMDEA